MLKIFEYLMDMILSTCLVKCRCVLFNFTFIMFMKIFKIYGVNFPKSQVLRFIVSSSNFGLLGDQDCT